MEFFVVIEKIIKSEKYPPHLKCSIMVSIRVNGCLCIFSDIAPFSPPFDGVKLEWKIDVLSPVWSKFKFATLNWILRNAAPTYSFREGGGF